MKRTLVISDIHGELGKFNKLLQQAEYDAGKDQLILLGDYVDRGPNSKGVISRVMELKDQGAIVLRGNHDDMMVAAVDNEPGAWERWAKNGAIHTLKSYDLSINSMEVPQTGMFMEHVSFIKELNYYYKSDGHIFVHAGVDPDVPIGETDPATLVWIREAFHLGYHGKETIVFGHTPTAHLHGKKDANGVYFGGNNIIGIDGSAVFGGNLNCLELHSNKVYTVDERTYSKTLS